MTPFPLQARRVQSFVLLTPFPPPHTLEAALHGWKKEKIAKKIINILYYDHQNIEESEYIYIDEGNFSLPKILPESRLQVGRRRIGRGLDATREGIGSVG